MVFGRNVDPLTYMRREREYISHFHIFGKVPFVTFSYTLWALHKSFTHGYTWHYENTPIQIYRKFHLQKLKIFR